MRRPLALAVLTAIACGGSDSPARPAPIPTATPAPNFSGTYIGATVFNVSGLAESRPVATVSVTHSDPAITFGNLALTENPAATSLPLGSGAIVNGTATATINYASAGCGIVTTITTARFAGNLMNLTVVLSATGNCPRSELRGELRRQ